MTDKRLPFTLDQLEALTAAVPTPFHVYDEPAMKANAVAFREAFAWVQGGFRNYFAVKALPNPHVMAVLRAAGMGADWVLMLDCDEFLDVRRAEIGRASCRERVSSPV